MMRQEEIYSLVLLTKLAAFGGMSYEMVFKSRVLKSNETMETENI